MNVSGVELIEKDCMVCLHQKKTARPFEASSLSIWGEVAKRGGVLIDIGAYSGVYSIKAAQNGATVYSLEPNEAIFKRLNENAALNNVKINSINAGAASSCRPGFLAKSFAHSSAAKVSDEGAPIQLLTVDSLALENVGAIKIDVEGLELEVLTGALETIKASKPLIITEALDKESEEEQAAFLERLGYYGTATDERNIVWRQASTAEFWRNEGLLHVTPPDTTTPEGFDVNAELKNLLGEEPVLEIGCGWGRLASAFNPSNYIGFDINETAIKAASAAFPEYTFTATKPKTAKNVLLYTVLLHVSDEEILGFICGLDAEKVVIAEIMDEKWRRDGVPPVFNRFPSRYIELFGRAGYHLTNSLDKSYPHYDDTKITFMVFEK